MPAEPHQKRVIAFVDGQNLFFNAKQAFAHHYPNYDIKKLSDSIAAQQTNWTVVEARFYTGVPDAVNDPLWDFFWNAKLASMGRAGVYTFHRNKQNRMHQR